MAAIREPKAVEMRYAHIRALLLHPCICAHFGAHFLVHGTGILGLGKLVRHGAAEDDFPGLLPALGLDAHQDTDVEAASDPCVTLQNGACVMFAQPQVSAGESLDRVSLLPEVICQGFDRRAMP